eukprot:2342701-Prymnesium_polylepis.1
MYFCSWYDASCGSDFFELIIVTPCSRGRPQRLSALERCNHGATQPAHAQYDGTRSSGRTARVAHVPVNPKSSCLCGSSTDGARTRGARAPPASASSRWAAQSRIQPLHTGQRSAAAQSRGSPCRRCSRPSGPGSTRRAYHAAAGGQSTPRAPPTDGPRRRQSSMSSRWPAAAPARAARRSPSRD